MLTEQENDELIQQAQAGDEQALAQLFDYYRPKLLRMIQLRMDPSLRARIDEDDVLQDTFIELARKIREYSRVGELPFFLWLRMTAGETLFKLYHKHVDVKMRTAKREIGIFQRVPNASTFFLASKLVGRFTSVDRNLIREEVHQKLQSALNQLETEDRELLAMRYYEELTSDEIAMTMGGELTGSGVRKRLLRSLRKLRQGFQSETDLKI